MQVRRLICACLVQLYLVGDTLPLYSRVASLQSYLGSKVGFIRVVIIICHEVMTNTRQPEYAFGFRT